MLIYFKKLVNSSTHTAEVDDNQNAKSRRLFILDNSTNTKFLIDTGSDVSVLPATTYDRRSSPLPTKLHAANNSTINTYKYKQFQVDLGLRKPFNWNFIIADTNTAIIGADFLSHHNLSVNLRQRRLVDNNSKLSSRCTVGHPNICNVTTIDNQSSHHELLQKFIEITTPAKLSSTTNADVAHHIVTKGPSKASKGRRLAPHKLKAAKQEFQTLMDLGICRRSSSCWASPLHVTTKKSGEFRIVGDYRKLNSVTIPDKYPLPHIHDLLNDFHGKTIFTTLDLQRAYHQIPMAEEDIPKTAVITPFGLYEFTRMQFGLCNAAQTFQRHMHKVFGDLDFVTIYIDDICIASKTANEHKEHLRTVFERLKENKLVINVEKCEFSRDQVEFLGYMISAKGVKPVPKRVNAIRKFNPPKTVKELRRFLAMLNSYKRFIRYASHKQQPLRKFISGNKRNDKTPILWDDEAIKAFTTCKDALADATLLHYPDPIKPLALFVDASNEMAGGTLQQHDGLGWEPLGFYSESFAPPAKKYSTFGRELAAMKMAVKYFQHMLEGRKFTIFTDHNPLTGALASNSDIRLPREIRHLQFISQFTQDIRHISGKDNYVADTLSRVSSIETVANIDYDEIALSQIGDDQLQKLLNTSNSLKWERKKISGSTRELYCDVSLKGRARPYIPKQFRDTVMKKFHQVSHPGIRGTRRLLTERFVWPSINKDVRNLVVHCQECQQSKVLRHNTAPLQQFDLPDARFSHIHTDIVGPLKPSKDKRYILTIIDRFSRWPEAIPLEDQSAETVAKTLYREWICRYGTPEIITTDQGRNFESTLMAELNQIIGTHKVRTTSYHPQANGIVERFHRTLKAAIMCRDSDTWVDQLPTVLLGLRAAYREDMKNSSAELVFGQTLKLPGEFFEETSVHNQQTEFAQQMHRIFDNLRPIPASDHSTRKPFIMKELQNCTHVYVRDDTSGKPPLKRPYDGPFKVEERHSKYMDLNIRGKKSRVSIDRIKPAFVARPELIEHPADRQDTKILPSGHKIRFLV